MSEIEDLKARIAELEAELARRSTVFIPNCKTEFVLTAPWTFRLYDERRNNAKFRDSMGVHFESFQDWLGRTGTSLPGDWQARRVVYDRYQAEKGEYKEVTLPVGTILRVGRVYIRTTTSDTYDSLTFTIKKRGKKDQAAGHTAHGRFWAKLADVNKMQADVYLGKDHGTLPVAEVMSRIALLFED